MGSLDIVVPANNKTRRRILLGNEILVDRSALKVPRLLCEIIENCRGSKVVVLRNRLLKPVSQSNTLIALHVDNVAPIENKVVDRLNQPLAIEIVVGRKDPRTTSLETNRVPRSNSETVDLNHRLRRPLGPNGNQADNICWALRCPDLILWINLLDDLSGAICHQNSVLAVKAAATRIMEDSH